MSKMHEMTGVSEGLKHSSSDPALLRRVSIRSLVRQSHVDENHDTSLGGSGAIGGPLCTTSSEQSICLLTPRHSSVQSASPIGDMPAMLSTSDGRTHVLLHNVGRTIQRTGSQLRKTRLFHIFYFLVLPVYTVLGALLFQALDGEHDERLRREYDDRCQGRRAQDLLNLSKYKEECQFVPFQNNCNISTPDDCFVKMRSYLIEVEDCYRRWHAVNRTVTHSMADFSNALIYAFSVYTTIGYGNMAADTVNCRIATIFYGALGIPLFFAFVKEEGNLCRDLFIATYKKLRKLKRKVCNKCRGSDAAAETPPEALANGNGNCLGVPTTHLGVGVCKAEEGALSRKERKAHFSRRQSNNSLLGGRHHLLDEQRKVFIAGCFVFFLYILIISWFVKATTDFDYFTAMYFLFNSVALIGFGDVFPHDPRIIIVHAGFMVLGVVLFSMCYFILQEEIREKAFEASRKARISISKYGHTISSLASARSPWSRRNSPLFDASSDNGVGGQSSFQRLKKRRQSAPAIALTAPGGKTRFRGL